MKKIAYALVLAGMGMSASVFAEPAAVPSSGQISAADDCELLSENVRLNLSTNVVAAFNCDVATNTITVGACHNAGSRNSSLTCAQIGTDSTTGDPIFNDDQCTAQAVADGTVIEGSPDFRGFFAQTSGGSVAPAFLGGNCSAQILTAHDKLGN